MQENHGLVTIRIKPDEHGRFGFNVKVGSWLSDIRVIYKQIVIVVYSDSLDHDYGNG